MGRACRRAPLVLVSAAINFCRGNAKLSASMRRDDSPKNARRGLLLWAFERESPRPALAGFCRNPLPPSVTAQPSETRTVALWIALRFELGGRNCPKSLAFIRTARLEMPTCR